MMRKSITPSFMNNMAITLAGAMLAVTPMLGCGGTSTNNSGTTNSTSQGSTSSTDSSSKPVAKSSMPVSKVKINEKEMKAALEVVASAVRQISFMTDDAGHEKSRTGVLNAHGIIDVPAVKKALDIVSILPDNKANEFIPVFSIQLKKAKEVIELYEAAIASGKPFSDGSGTGPKMAKLAADTELSFTVAAGQSMAITEKE